jgi:Sec7-like guanine-nucleotide exchange factor
MIDRVMEQFGPKYYNDNPTHVFTCADTVSVLSFATLMVHTDAHHPLVEKSMILEQFLRNVKGQYGEQEFSKDFLADFYQKITVKPIFHTQSFTSAQDTLLSPGALPAEMFRDDQRNESHPILSDRSRVFHCSESPSFVCPMFPSIWRF